MSRFTMSNWACCYGQSFLMERLLKKYMAKPQTEEEAEKWYYK